MSRTQEEQKVRRDQFARLACLAEPEAVPIPPWRWSDEEWDTIRQSHRSRYMDDKWHAFVENNRLFLHSSWTAFGISEALAHPRLWHITELLVCDDHSIYRRARDAYEALFVESLIDSVVLGNRNPAHG